MARASDVLSNRRTRGSKIVYGGIRRYLPRQHPYYRNSRFIRMAEHGTGLSIVSGVDVIRYAVWRQAYLDLCGTKNGKYNPMPSTRVIRLSALYELLNW